VLIIVKKAALASRCHTKVVVITWLLSRGRYHQGKRSAAFPVTPNDQRVVIALSYSNHNES